MCVLKACGIAGSVEIGEEMDAEMRKRGLLQSNDILVTALVDMYFKCGAIEKARELFDQFPSPNVISWSAMINGYAQHGLGHEALRCFKCMQDAGVCPNAVTYLCTLKACGIVRSLEVGQNIDAEIRRQRLLEKDVVLGNALVDMYAKCGALGKAREVFDELPVHSAVAWSSLMTGYAQLGLGDEALKCFREMGDGGVALDAVTYTCILKACGKAGSLGIGEGIGSEVRKQGLAENDAVLGTALVDMYIKCGALERAGEAFEHLRERNVVTWSALIAGHSQLGRANAAMSLYKRMRSEGVVPNSITFVVLLTACAHAGLVKEGENLFDEMSVAHRIQPTPEHYTCMIELACRAARFDKVNELLANVSHSCQHLPLFVAILDACVEWRNAKLARWAFERSVRLEEKCASAYVLLQKLYANGDGWS
jgi:pentatricopeptide repeat protein